MQKLSIVKKVFQKHFPGVLINLSKSKEKKYDIYLKNEFTYNSNTTSQNNTKIHYISNTLTCQRNRLLKKVWSIITDYNLIPVKKLLQSDNNLNTNIWNARLQRTLKTMNLPHILQ